MRLDDENFGEMSPYGVRLPRELKAKIKSAAKANRHSMNAEIVKRLEKTFSEDEVLSHLEDAPFLSDDDFYELINDKAEQYKSLKMAIHALNSAFSALNKK